MSKCKYQTETSLHIAQLKVRGDLRIDAPPTDVKVFKLINGKAIFDRVDPPMSYEQALIMTGQNYDRHNKMGGG